MERVVENPANPLRGRERGGFDNSPNWEKSGSADCAWVIGCCLCYFCLQYMSGRFHESFVHLFPMMMAF